MDVTKRKAAALGAAHGVAGAVFLLAFVAAARAAGSRHWTIAAFELLFEAKKFGVGAVYAVTGSLAAAGLVGAAMGVLARRLAASTAIRVIVLGALAFPALYAVVALSLMLFLAPVAAKESPSALGMMPVMCLLYAAIGTVVVAPLASLPAVAAALMLEGWTRPSTLGQGGLANPIVRRRALQLLLMVTVALLTFALRR